jgi:hypothetical protein
LIGGADTNVCPTEHFSRNKPRRIANPFIARMPQKSAADASRLQGGRLVSARLLVSHSQEFVS